MDIKTKKYKIVSNGTPEGTYIYDPDGNEIKEVLELHYSISCDDLFGTATIVVPAEIELKTNNVRVAKVDKKTELTGEKEIDPTYDDSSNDFIDYLMELLNGKKECKDNDKKHNLHTFAFYRQLPND